MPKSDSSVEPKEQCPQAPEEYHFKRDLRFWLIFLSLCSCILLSALDLGGIATAAPTIVHELNGEDFTWVTAAYSLSSAACMPLNGNLAEIFGRRPVILTGIVIFAAGSAVSASAHSMTTLIVGRAIQGLGGGMVEALTAMIVADIVPLRELGKYNGITGSMWALGTITGPFISGGLSQKASWRWIFYINLPLAGIAFACVFTLLRVKTVPESVWTKLSKIDWLGNLIIIGSSCSCLLAITWGGVRFPWSSAHIIVPLVVGLVGFMFALLYESRYPTKPVIPTTVISNRTTLCGYVGAFLHMFVMFSVGFYLPTWFQSVKTASPVLSGLYVLARAVTISPSAILQGQIVSRTGKYRPVMFFGWCALLLGVGLLITINENTSIGLIILYQLISGVGMGSLYSITFSVLAPLPVTMNAPAIALLAFLRIFAQAWSVAITGSIMQNFLLKRLPDEFLRMFPQGVQLSYAAIPIISTLPEDLKKGVEAGFVKSLRAVWTALEVIAAIGFISLFIMKDVPLRTTVDKKWANDQKEQDDENSSGEKTEAEPKE
ncbi:iron permease [Cyathus striatus]|nr:iron permease [Cyathus striatus]